MSTALLKSQFYSSFRIVGMSILLFYPRQTIQPPISEKKKPNKLIFIKMCIEVSIHVHWLKVGKLCQVNL